MTNTVHNEREVSLMDIIKAVRKHKILFFSIIFITVILGLAFALTQKKQYKISQPIYISYYLQGNNKVDLQALVTVQDKIENIYIPAWEQQYNATHVKPFAPKYKFDDAPTTPNNTGIIYLTTTAQKADIDDIKALHNAILTSAQLDEKPLMESFVATTNDTMSAIQSQINILGKLQGDTLNYGEKGNVINDTLNSKAKVDGLIALRDVYISSLQQNNSMIALQNQLISAKQTLDTLQPTKLGDFIVAQDPSQISKAVIVLLALVLGFIAATFIVILRSFINFDQDKK